MADWFIATEGVKVVKDSASLWPQIITAISSAGAALGGVCLTHRFTRRREERATADKSAAERLYIVTELVFLLEHYASDWTELRWSNLDELSRKKNIPALDLSGASGDWRVLSPRQIFKIRSLEADHAALALQIKQIESPADERECHSVTLACFQTGLRAFLLAAKLRREVGLSDSARLRDTFGSFWFLLESRRRYWSTEVALRKTDNEAFASWMSLKSQSEDNHKEGGRN